MRYQNNSNTINISTVLLFNSCSILGTGLFFEWKNQQLINTLVTQNKNSVKMLTDINLKLIKQNEKLIEKLNTSLLKANEAANEAVKTSSNYSWPTHYTSDMYNLSLNSYLTIAAIIVGGTLCFYGYYYYVKPLLNYSLSGQIYSWFNSFYPKDDSSGGSGAKLPNTEIDDSIYQGITAMKKGFTITTTDKGNVISAPNLESLDIALDILAGTTTPKTVPIEETLLNPQTHAGLESVCETIAQFSHCF